MLTTIILTAVGYGSVLHMLRRIRAYLPPARMRDALDTALKVMGGGGSGPILPK